jgi:hypothetical protein
MDGLIQMTVRDIPVVDRMLECALPIVFTDPDYPDYPGIQGTCFAVRYRGRVGFLTAGHVVGGAERAVAQSVVQVPLSFNERPSAAGIAHVITRRTNVPDLEDVCDIALLVPQGEVAFVAGESAPIEIDRVADMRVARPRSLLAVRGYPNRHPTKNRVDYDLRAIDLMAHSNLGTYVGPAQGMPGCHTMNLDSRSVGGANGLSGGPVVKAIIDTETRAWDAALAGLVIRGNEALIHFVDVAWLLPFLEANYAHLPPAT